MNEKLLISFFSASDKESINLAEDVISKIKINNKKAEFKRYTGGEWDKKILINCCMQSDIIIFDATVEKDTVEKHNENYSAAILPLRYLRNVIIFSRNYLPMNFYGLHNWLNMNAQRNTSSSCSDSKTCTDNLSNWICDKVYEIVNSPNKITHIENCNSVKFDHAAEDLLYMMSIMRHIFTIKDIKFNGTQEMGYFLSEYYQIGTLVYLYLYIGEDDAPNEFISNLVFTEMFVTLERIFSEYMIKAEYGMFPEAIYKFDTIFSGVKRHFHNLKLGKKNLSLFLCNCLASNAMKKFLTGKLSLIDRVKWSLFFKEQDLLVEKYLNKLYGLYKNEESSFQDDFFTSIIAKARVDISLNLSKLIRNLKDYNFSLTMEDIILEEIKKEHKYNSQFPIDRKDTFNSIVSNLLYSGLDSINYYGQKLDESYTSFISYRTSEFNQAKLLKSITEGIGFIVDPNTFSTKNEIFSTYLRFHIMKELYQIILRMDKFIIYNSKTYLNSWWTIFELLTFINAKEDNINRVIFAKEREAFDLKRFILTKGQLFKLQRYLLYSNPSILHKDQLMTLPYLYDIFPSGNYEITEENIWNAKLVQCVNNTDIQGFTDFETFMKLESPLHIFFKDSLIKSGEEVSCPNFLKGNCSKVKTGQINPCRFRFKESSHKRYFWLDYEVPEKCLEQETVYEYEVVDY